MVNEYSEDVCRMHGDITLSGPLGQLASWAVFGSRVTINVDLIGIYRPDTMDYTPASGTIKRREHEYIQKIWNHSRGESSDPNGSSL